MAPTFIMMLGVSGAGKTTLAQFIAPELDACILSSESIRKELCCNNRRTRHFNQPEVFQLMNERALLCLAKGKSVIYDATNLWSRPRQKLLDELPEGVTKECVWLKAPLESAVLNDADSGKHTPRGIIQMQAMMLQPPTYGEGWDHIKVVSIQPPVIY